MRPAAAMLFDGISARLGYTLEQGERVHAGSAMLQGTVAF